MFRTLIYPSSGACDYSVELPHWSYCSWFDVCWSFGAVGLEWYPYCRLQPATRIMSETCWAHKKWNKIASDIKLVFYSSTITMMHGPINIRSWVCICSLREPASNAHGPYYHLCRKLLMMDILMSETCWALKKWNKIASDMKLVFYSSHMYGICWISIVSSYSKNWFPFFLFCFFNDGQCYHSVCIAWKCRYLMLIWMVRRKLNSGISACGFSIDTCTNVIFVSVYGEVQIICVVFLCRYFELKVYIYLVDLM